MLHILRSLLGAKAGLCLCSLVSLSVIFFPLETSFAQESDLPDEVESPFSECADDDVQCFVDASLDLDSDPPPPEGDVPEDEGSSSSSGTCPSSLQAIANAVAQAVPSCSNHLYYTESWEFLIHSPTKALCEWAVSLSDDEVEDMVTSLAESALQSGFAACFSDAICGPVQPGTFTYYVARSSAKVKARGPLEDLISYCNSWLASLAAQGASSEGSSSSSAESDSITPEEGNSSSTPYYSY